VRRFWWLRFDGVSPTDFFGSSNTAKRHPFAVAGRCVGANVLARTPEGAPHVDANERGGHHVTVSSLGDGRGGKLHRIRLLRSAVVALYVHGEHVDAVIDAWRGDE
jgi:hypothetical protein